jgi:hypothetical protein
MWKSERETWDNLNEHAAIWFKPDFSAIDDIFTIELGTVWARTIEQYKNILGSHFSQFIDSLHKYSYEPRIIDVGCGCCYFLLEMKQQIQAQCIGLDVRNVRNNTLKIGNQSWNVGSVLDNFRINFIQLSYTELPDLIQGGYDLLTCVGAFPEEDDHPLVRAEILYRFANGLRSGGAAFINYAVSNEAHKIILNELSARGIRFDFEPIDQSILANNALNFDLPVQGTFILYG